MRAFRHHHHYHDHDDSDYDRRGSYPFRTSPTSSTTITTTQKKKTTTTTTAFTESHRSPPPPPPPGTSLEHYQHRYEAHSPSRRSTEGMSLPRPPISPGGALGPSARPAAAAVPPALPPLGAGASASTPPVPGGAGPSPSTSIASPGRPPPPTNILPPLRSLDGGGHRPSLPPPIPPNSSHQQPPLPPPSHPTLSPHRPPPPHLPYDSNHHYARGRSTSPSGPPRSMGSHIPPPQQQHHHPPPVSHHGSPHHGMQMQHGPPPPGYYGQPPPPPPGSYGPHHHVPHGMDPNAYRMPLPAPMGVMQQHRPSKKEIKRRTKTGCLTCRKRRIKCDEGHPTCRNCEKSKRECLGYDPIFKTQSQPSSIQAAPSAPPSARPPPAPHGGYPPNSQPYMAPPNHAYPPQMPPGQPMPPPGYGEFNQAAIDPKLEQAEAPIAAPTAIESLLDLGNGRPPPTIQRTEALSETELTKAKDVYHLVYGTGLDKFFETSWFTARSWEHIVQNNPLVEKVALLESRFHVTAESDAEANMANQSLEGHILWDIMQLCRQVASGIDSADTESPDVKHGVQDAAKRIRAFEFLVTHQKLDAADVIAAPTPSEAVPGAPGLPAQLEERKHGFWHHVSTFCTLKLGEGSASEADGSQAAAVETNLNEIRQLLDSFENRDILYSIAIVSHYMRPGSEPVGAPTSNSDSEGASKVSVARTFMQREATSGTFQVAKVVGGMVLRSWKPKA